jgi:hypothetical protein
MSDTWDRRAPWFGIAAAVCALLVVIIGGETPDFDASRAEIVNHYDDQASAAIAAALAALTGLFFVFFAATLRARMRAAESLSTLTLVGGAIFAIGLTIFAGLEFTLADLVNSDKPIDPGTLQALNSLDSDLFFPAVLGLATFYFSTAFAILSTGALPRWWGWVTLALAILSVLGPLGFAAFVLTLPWTLVSGILLLLGDSGQETAVGTAPGAGP